MGSTQQVNEVEIGKTSNGNAGVPQPKPENTRIDGGPVEPGLRGTDEEIFTQVLAETIEAMERGKVPYALIGGIAASGFGRPRWTHDIDVFVKPEDAGRALDALDACGFRTERTDPRWLYKGYKEDVMVDIIFRSTGGFYLDQEMLDRAVKYRFKGHDVRLVPPEDLVIMKAVVHDEAGPRHWHDALSIIACGNVDWEYLSRRALKAPRRVLSLLIYAQSVDTHVPNDVIRQLHAQLFGN